MQRNGEKETDSEFYGDHTFSQVDIMNTCELLMRRGFRWNPHGSIGFLGG